VVFAHNRQVIDHIKGALEQDASYQGAVGVIYGGVSPEDRAEAVRRFQEDANSRVILVSISAGGFGLTLTAASAVAFVQLPWSPGELDQAADRVHRVGQKANTVDIFFLVADNTIEDHIIEMIDSKRLIVDAAIDDK
jgi:SNF2 family DNA or RNA helicase